MLWLHAPVHILAGTTGNEGPPEPPLHDLSADRMLADVAVLSSAALNGRQTGTAADLSSALVVARQLASLDLVPAGRERSPDLGEDTWFTTASVTTYRIEDGIALAITAQGTVQAELGRDYLPILDSPSAKVTAPAVFIGYGISDPARGWDDYSGLDVRNRVVIFLRGKPTHFPVRVPHAAKERVARNKGAVGFLTVTGPLLSAYEARRGMSTNPLAYYGREAVDGSTPLPGAWISPELADRILASTGQGRSRSLGELQAELNVAEAPTPFPIDVQVRLAWQTIESEGLLMNVLGLIPGNGPLAKETVVVGAHRDHFGRQAGLLFPGADDNASGTAILIEVARAIMASGARPQRTILFASFSGEEQGLLGSRLYVSRPTRSLEHTVAMINVDHAGIGNGRLTVGVNGISKESAVEAGRIARLEDKLDLFGYFPGGDHVPFKEAGVPTIAIVSAGRHPPFHQPTDQLETLDPHVLHTVARYVLSLTWLLSHAEL